MFPKAQYPLTEDQLQASIAQRSDSTVVESDDSVMGFANFYTFDRDGVCAIGNKACPVVLRNESCERFWKSLVEDRELDSTPNIRRWE